jgi:RNA ligase
MKVNLKEFRKRSKYINETKHPILDLIIWNYSNECQYDKKWDKYTMMCRGLITDSQGRIVARPFKKFFNWGEDINIKIPKEMPIISEKKDGSLGIQYYSGDEVFIATRGSFQSDQALWANDWIRDKRFKKKDFLPGKTYLWEIIYKNNRIVIDYKGWEGLVLLAVIDNETGDETFRDVETEAERLGVNYASRIEVDDLDKLVESTNELSGDEEGYVFHWPKKQNLRMMVKGKEYLRLHKLLTEFSTISLWETLKAKKDLNEVLDRVPDEFFAWVKDTENKLIGEYQALFEKGKEAYEKVVSLDTRKEQALKILKKYGDVADIAFRMLDGRDPSDVIWKRIRPTYSKPFTKDEI